MPCRPSAPILGQRSRGNWLVLSISAARGAISLLAKPCTVSRMASAVSPRSKLKTRQALGIMVAGPPEKIPEALPQAYSLRKRLSRAEIPSRGKFCDVRGVAPGRKCGRAKCGLLRRAQRAVIGSRKNGREPAMDRAIDFARPASLDAARERAMSLPLADFDPGDPELFRSDTHWPYFDRLRLEDPVHYCKDSMFGPYWSVTRYNDIMDIDTNHAVFSSASALGGITIRDVAPDLRRESFIAMDQPRHSAQRKTVAPMFTPTNLDELAVNIRKRSAECLDNLPRNETFNFVERVSIELTTQMLAVLFDFPWEDRRKLTWWSDVATTLPGVGGLVATEDDRQVALMECAQYFAKLWNERIKQPPKNDLLSMMAHNDATRDMDPKNFLGNLILLIVGGNDTTRNTMSGSIYALNKFPDQYRKLRENPALLDSFVPEVIRWQTPLAHMRRTALEIEFRGKQIRKGDKVVM